MVLKMTELRAEGCNNYCLKLFQYFAEPVLFYFLWYIDFKERKLPVRTVLYDLWLVSIFLYTACQPSRRLKVNQKQ